MIIGIDLRPFFTGSKTRGIGTYTRELIKRLIEKDNENTYCFLNLYGKYEGDPVLNEKCRIFSYDCGPMIVDVGQRQLLRDPGTMQLVEAAVKNFIRNSKIDVMLFTTPNEYGNMYKAEWFKGVYTVGILYDLIPLTFPDQCLFDPVYTKDYNESLEFIKDLDHLLAISDFTRTDAIKKLNIPKENITSIYSGVSQKFVKRKSVEIGKLKEKYGFTDEYIMFAGGIDFKKNINGLIEAYSKCSKQYVKNYQLVIVGKTDEGTIKGFRETAKKCGVEDRVVIAGFVPDDDLIDLYNCAYLLAFPSLFEGFGLPVIEAMACGTRVLTADNSSLHEIAYGYATMVNAKSVKSIRDGLEYVFNHPVETADLAVKAKEHAGEYTWERTADLADKAIADGYKIFSERNSVKEDSESSRREKFEVTKSLLNNIVDLYYNSGSDFSENTIERLSVELDDLQNSVAPAALDPSHRVLYDVTIVKGWIVAHYSTGIGRVCKELYKELNKLIYTVPITVTGDRTNFTINGMSDDFQTVVEPNLTIRDTDIYLMPEIHLRGPQVDPDYPSPADIGPIKKYAFIYDILPIRLPQYFETKTVKEFPKYVKELTTECDGIITDSYFVDKDVHSYCEERGIKTKDGLRYGFIHLGYNSFPKTSDVNGIKPEIVDFFNTDEKIFLMVGTIEPRKGHQNVLKAFREMWKEGKEYKLCFIGHLGWNMDTFVDEVKNECQENPKMGFFEGVSDKELNYAYERASTVIQASAGEGFGLPLMEASDFKKPILCSNLEVFREVAGDHALYFNRDSIESIKEIVKKYVTMPADSPELQSGEIQKTNWKDAAEKVYKMVIQDTEWSI